MSRSDEANQKQNNYNGIFVIIAAIIAAVGYIIVAFINRSTSFIPIHATQTAEALYTSIAINTQAPTNPNPSSSPTLLSPAYTATTIPLPPRDTPSSAPSSSINLPPVINNLLLALLVLLIEYFVFQPIQKLPTASKKKLGLASLVSITLFVPLLLLQALSLRFAESIGIGMPVTQRVDIYANTYGILAVLWGCIWTAFVRPLLYRLGGNVQ